jgi:hypothetical protein
LLVRRNWTNDFIIVNKKDNKMRKEKLKEVTIPLKRLKRIAEYYEIPIIVFFSDNRFPHKTRDEYRSELAFVKLERLISQLETIIEEYKEDLRGEK